MKRFSNKILPVVTKTNLKSVPVAERNCTAVYQYAREHGTTGCCGTPSGTCRRFSVRMEERGLGCSRSARIQTLHYRRVSKAFAYSKRVGGHILHLCGSALQTGVPQQRSSLTNTPIQKVSALSLRATAGRNAPPPPPPAWSVKA